MSSIQFSAYSDDTCSFAYSSLPGPQSAGYDSAFPFPRAPSAHCLAVFAWYTGFLRRTNFRQDKDNLGGQQSFYKRKHVSLAQNCVQWIHFPISHAGCVLSLLKNEWTTIWSILSCRLLCKIVNVHNIASWLGATWSDLIDHFPFPAVHADRLVVHADRLVVLASASWFSDGVWCWWYD